MIVEIGSHKLFYGFYESMYDNSDMFVDDESEISSQLKDLGYDVEIEIDVEDYTEYKKDVCKEFMNVYVETVIDSLPSEITENEKFKFEIVDDDNNIVISSPKYYNYTTDKCFCDVETNIETLEMIKEYTLNLEGASEYIIKHHSSYDGFISFIKNDIEYWRELSIDDYIYEERYLIALLDMLIILSNNNDIKFEMNYDVYDKVCVYEYTITYVYFEDKKYELNEFAKLKNVEVY